MYECIALPPRVLPRRSVRYSRCDSDWGAFQLEAVKLKDDESVAAEQATLQVFRPPDGEINHAIHVDGRGEDVLFRDASAPRLILCSPGDASAL